MAEKILDFRFKDGSKPNQIPSNPLFTIGIDPQDPYDEDGPTINGAPLTFFKDPANLGAFPGTNPRVLSEAIEMALMETREAFFEETSLPEKKALDIRALALMTEMKVIVPPGGYMMLQRKVWEMCNRHFGEKEADRMLAPYGSLITQPPVLSLVN